MDIKTKHMGIVSVPQEQIIKMPNGLIGFEQYTEYALIESEYKPFIWMQSTQESSLAFLTIDPFLVCDEYEVDIDDSSLATIDIKSPSDIFVLTIITITEGSKNITANFQGPVIVNKKNHLAMQAISSDNRWTTKYNILAALSERRS